MQETCKPPWRCDTREGAIVTGNYRSKTGNIFASVWAAGGAAFDGVRVAQ
jgi:hypothetical protein